MHAGFSLGGLLAIYVAACIWATSHRRSDIMEKRIICIALGQPVVTISFIKHVAENFPEFESTVHSVFSEEDMVPQLLNPLTCISQVASAPPQSGGSTRPMLLSSPSPATGAQVVDQGMVSEIVMIFMMLTLLYFFQGAQETPAAKYFRCLAQLQSSTVLS